MKTVKVQRKTRNTERAEKNSKFGMNRKKSKYSNTRKKVNILQELKNSHNNAVTEKLKPLQGQKKISKNCKKNYGTVTQLI